MSGDQWRNLCFIVVILLVASVLVGVLGGYSGISVALAHRADGTGAAAAPDDVTARTMDYINANFLGEESVAYLEGVNEANGVYHLNLSVVTGELVQQSDAYLTKDGKMLFPFFYNTSEDTPLSTVDTRSLLCSGTVAGEKPVPEPTFQVTCADLPKADKPLLEVFVVSYCPFGTQMQRALANAVAKAPEIGQYIKVRYIGDVRKGNITSMHGEEEAVENLRQISIREEQPDRYWPYISCFIKSGNADECLKNAKVDTKKLKISMNEPDRAPKFAQVDFNLSDTYRAYSSPTLVLNGVEVDEFSFGGRSPDVARALLCCGSNETRAFCNQTLDTNNAAVGFADQARQYC